MFNSEKNAASIEAGIDSSEKSFSIIFNLFNISPTLAHSISSVANSSGRPKCMQLADTKQWAVLGFVHGTEQLEKS